MRIASEGIPFVVVAAVIAVAAGVAFSPWAAAALTLPVLFVVWFFRDPGRTVPDEHGLLVAPADGRVVVASPRRVSVFMNVFDVHVCRSPVAGTVESVDHTPGRFLNAARDEASEQNERVRIVIRTPEGAIAITLVAGLIARRIVPWVEPGTHLERGERVGLIRFGSRVDLELPEAAARAVAVGDRVTAGETVVARIAATASGSL